MALFEGKTPAERNKMIAAIALPLVALFFIVYMFSGPSKPSTTTANANVRPKPRATIRQQQTQPDASAPADAPEDLVSITTPIVCCAEPYLGADAGRNIFAFYVKPTPPAGPPVAVTTPEPTPTPPPPLTLASLAPQSVFARTGNFTLQASGDKFGPAARIYVDGQEMPTQYKSMQQLTATVPATLISSPGQHSVIVRTHDNALYSNPQTLNVMQPPAPTYTFVGFLKRQRANNTAVLKDQKGELYSVRQGDIVEGRFRVTDISERGVEVVDKDLNIKHTLPFVESRNGSLTGRAPGSIQPPPPSSEDGEEEP
jgi:hypothetical protein